MISRVTRRVVPVAGSLLALLATAACNLTGSHPAGESSAQPAPAAAPVALPPQPQPTANGPCPYLQTEFVAEANGQHVGKVRVSADQPHPACFFYRPDGGLQLTARVYVGDPKVAKGLVDQAAPVGTSNPASLDGGWQGGSQPTDSGAVYAVAKGGEAIVVTTNQKQTIKARRVTEQVISALAL
nr:DUF2020 domain-containing protein [Gandjariella thermophila]